MESKLTSPPFVHWNDAVGWGHHSHIWQTDLCTCRSVPRGIRVSSRVSTYMNRFVKASVLRENSNLQSVSYSSRYGDSLSSLSTSVQIHLKTILSLDGWICFGGSSPWNCMIFLILSEEESNGSTESLLLPSAGTRWAYHRWDWITTGLHAARVRETWQENPC